MALSEKAWPAAATERATAEALRVLHNDVQRLTTERRLRASQRTRIAKQAQAEGATIPEIQALLGLSRTGVVKILAGAKAEK